MLLRTPLVYRTITSPYGPRDLAISDNYHDGEDHRAEIGTPCFPLMDECYVMKARKKDLDAWGKYIVLYQPEFGLQFIYAHLSEVYVEENQKVYMDDVIAATGNTGSSTGPHLHIGIYTSSFDDIFDKDPDNGAKHKHSVNPANYFDLLPSDISNLSVEGYVAMIRAINDGYYELSNKVNPKDPVTREELAIVLQRLK